jgi:hypothetical protein
MRRGGTTKGCARGGGSGQSSSPTKPKNGDQRRQVVYERVKTEGDKLAAELAGIYPVFAEKLADLLPRIAANDREIEYINNHALPRSGGRLLVAEKNSVQIPRITEELRLPAFDYSAHDRYAWPRLR